MKNILIIGCGLIGSSVLRAAYVQSAAKNIYIYEINYLCLHGSLYNEFTQHSIVFMSLHCSRFCKYDL